MDWFIDHSGSQRTTCRTCTNDRRSACCCCRPSASVSASPGWCIAMKTSKCHFQSHAQRRTSQSLQPTNNLFFFWYIFTCFIKPVWQGSVVTINLTAWNTGSRFPLLCEHLTHGPHSLCSSSTRTQHLVSAHNPVKYHCSVLVLKMYKGFYTKDNIFYFLKSMMFLSVGEAFFLVDLRTPVLFCECCFLNVWWHNGGIFPSVRWQVEGALYDDSQSRYVSSRWAWVLQDALGIAFCLYMLKTVRLPTFKV